jgi:hypothetical protein
MENIILEIKNMYDSGTALRDCINILADKIKQEINDEPTKEMKSILKELGYFQYKEEKLPSLNNIFNKKGYFDKYIEKQETTSEEFLKEIKI